jgi:hypothetical protein
MMHIFDINDSKEVVELWRTVQHISRSVLPSKNANKGKQRMMNDMAVSSNSDWETALPLLSQAMSNPTGPKTSRSQSRHQTGIKKNSLFGGSELGMAENPRESPKYDLDPLISVQRKAHDIKSQILESPSQLPRTDILEFDPEEFSGQPPKLPIGHISDCLTAEGRRQVRH